MGIDITHMVSHVIAPPNGSVVLHFGMEDGEPFASTLPCVGIAIIGAYLTTPIPHCFDKVGSALDWQQARPLAITDCYIDSEMSENSIMVTPLTRMWEIVDKVNGWKDCQDTHEPTIEAIKLALARVGIYPQ
jgi:hypothetical protein